MVTTLRVLSGELRSLLIEPHTEELRGRSADLSAGKTCVSGSEKLSVKWP